MEYYCAHCGRPLLCIDENIERCIDHPNGAVEWTGAAVEQDKLIEETVDGIL